jgi:F-type H+-transporting ATPase subunit epsilon
MAGLQVEILTPKRRVYTGTANEVRAPGWEGELGVFPGHDLVLVRLRGGILTLVGTEGAEVRYVVGRGFLEVADDKVSVMTEACELPGGVAPPAAANVAPPAA